MTRGVFSLFYCFVLFFFLWLGVCRILLLRPATESRPLAVKCQILTTRLPGNPLSFLVKFSPVLSANRTPTETNLFFLASLLTLPHWLPLYGVGSLSPHRSQVIENHGKFFLFWFDSGLGLPWLYLKISICLRNNYKNYCLEMDTVKQRQRTVI